MRAPKRARQTTPEQFTGFLEKVCHEIRHVYTHRQREQLTHVLELKQCSEIEMFQAAKTALETNMHASFIFSVYMKARTEGSGVLMAYVKACWCAVRKHAAAGVPVNDGRVTVRAGDVLNAAVMTMRSTRHQTHVKADWMDLFEALLERMKNETSFWSDVNLQDAKNAVSAARDRLLRQEQQEQSSSSSSWTHNRCASAAEASVTPA